MPKVKEKAKVTCEVPDDGCEEEENTEKDNVDSFIKLDRQVALTSFRFFKSQGIIPSIATFYSEFLHTTVSPPPDNL